ncbi:restriction endonuclease subunit S [Helicobacter pylori]|uniref:restriction endonuclease subunit S n=1 Tax=Helicobacter pylori TaxID=210 RepID=UPI0009A43001|nr:restriction endonuclease subunit S [Helicobacter pylori]NHA72824.1 restriction endonuclease subunit S [Helicobacter pylori]OPG20823.1 restriction endonuclease subunit S [Helicobacter pylori]QEF34376.1 restriction endonuclease subunit S [Helicobacter pylori]
MDALTTPLPKDWEAVKVEYIFEIITDFSAAGSFAQQSQMVQYTNDRTNYAQLIRTTELKNGFNNTNAIYINKEAFEFLWRVNLNSDAIILPNIGINCGEIYYVDIKKLIHKHNALAPNAILLRTKKANLKFLFYAFLDTWFQKQLINIITSSAQPKFTKTDLRDLLIPLPPLNEQIAIANILSDVDRYLYSLDALILKKESVKKALSFELLSQRKRLKGFNQAWQKVRLGDICEITTGSLDANEMVHYGKYRFYTCAKEYYFIDKYAFDTEAILISGNGAYVGYVHYYKGKFNAYQRTYVLDNFSEHIIFVKYFLTMFLQSHIQTNRNEGNTPYIVMGTLKDFEILLPPLNEQAAIANILSDVDSEIISLKNKKRQFENIKKALNHDLMSAKIRVLKQ